MKQKLIASINRRYHEEISDKSPIQYLKRIPTEDLINLANEVVYLYTRSGKGHNKKNVYLTEVITAIGHGIRNSKKMKVDSSLAARTGAFILYSYQELHLINVVMGKGTNGHNSYIVEVIDDNAICKLWEKVPGNKTEKLPSTVPFAEWTTTTHKTGLKMIKTRNQEILEKVTPETHPIVYNTLNKAQRTGWRVNEEVHRLQAWAFRNKAAAFDEVWTMQNPDAKQSKIREVKAVSDISKRFIGQIFYHLYYYDFRGRKYPATAYFHEQGTDLAKGLLLRAESKIIGRDGFHWLLISIASNWAGDAGRDDGYKTDKIPLKDRIAWVLDNEEIILDYAENPKVNQGWMKADKPWQFIAACIELKKFRIWQMTVYEHNKDILNEFDYPSSLECYIDGSNNGSQHLSALTRDEITAPHVNLVPLDLPGDLYKYVADHVWDTLSYELSKIDSATLAETNDVVDTLIEMKKRIAETSANSEERKKCVEEIKAFKVENSALLDFAPLVFWSRVEDNKHRRKVVKRNTMTLPYGGTPYGLG